MKQEKENEAVRLLTMEALAAAPARGRKDLGFVEEGAPWWSVGVYLGAGVMCQELVGQQ